MLSATTSHIPLLFLHSTTNVYLPSLIVSWLKPVIFSNFFHPTGTFLRCSFLRFNVNCKKAVAVFIRIHPGPVVHECPQVIPFRIAAFLNCLVQPFQMLAN